MFHCSYYNGSVHLQESFREIKHIAKETNFFSKKDESLSNIENKQSLINLISQCVNDMDCHVIQPEGYADVEIKKGISVNVIR